MRAWHNHRYTMLRAGEQRGTLVATLDTALGPLTVLVTHLDHRPDDAERLTHVAELDALTRRLPHAVIVVGDFNAEPATAVHAAALRCFTDAWLEAGVGEGATYPADFPRKRIDWLLVRGAAFEVAEVIVVDERLASDHRPLRSVLRSPDAPRFESASRLPGNSERSGPPESSGAR